MGLIKTLDQVASTIQHKNFDGSHGYVSKSKNGKITTSYNKDERLSFKELTQLTQTCLSKTLTHSVEEKTKIIKNFKSISDAYQAKYAQRNFLVRIFNSIIGVFRLSSAKNNMRATQRVVNFDVKAEDRALNVKGTAAILSVPLPEKQTKESVKKYFDDIYAALSAQNLVSDDKKKAAIQLPSMLIIAYFNHPNTKIHKNFATLIKPYLADSKTKAQKIVLN